MRRPALAALLVVIALVACGQRRDPVAAEYEVVLEVSYSEELRVPGGGHVLRELDLDYSLVALVTPGTLVETEVHGAAAWTVRCYADPSIPSQDPSEVFTGEHPMRGNWELCDIRGSLEPEVDWTADAAVVTIGDTGVLTIAHRLPSALALDQQIRCDAESPYSAIALLLGDAAMTAPDRVVTSSEAFSQAQALNDSEGTPVYVLDAAGSGWVIGAVPITDLGRRPVPLSFSFDPGREPEGGASLVVTGTVRRAG